MDASLGKDIDFVESLLINRQDEIASIKKSVTMTPDSEEAKQV